MTRPTLALAATKESTDLDTDGVYLIPACERAGFDVNVPIWSDPEVDWAGFDLVVVRATWDYFKKSAEFLAWVDRVSKVTKFHNPPEVIAWNIDKRYLDEVAAAGFPVVDTTLSEIDTLGVRCLVYYRGVLDHTFHKEPLLHRDAEETALFLREEITAAEPTLLEQHLGDAVCDWLTNRFGGILYARVDLVEQAGEPVIMEIELIEPSFFLNVDPPSADRFAAVLQRLV